MSETAIRRSGRQKKVNISYSLDNPDESDASDALSGKSKESAYAAGAGVVDAEELDGQSSSAEGSLQDGSVGKSDDSGTERPPHRTRPGKVADGGSGVGRRATAQAKTSGVVGVQKKAGKEARLSILAGSDPLDVRRAMKSHEQWARESTFPSREPGGDGTGGMDYSAYYTPEMRRDELARAWTWYDQRGGRDAIGKRQKSYAIEPDEGMKYLRTEGSRSCAVLLGPVRDQKRYDLAPGSTIDVAAAFPHPAVDEQSRVNSRGTLINLGRRVHCVEWVPNNESRVQYLAASVMPYTVVPEVLGRPREDHTKPVSPFKPGPTHPSAIQVWAVRAKNSPGGRALEMCPGSAPWLKYVLSTDWGFAKQIKWCPVLRAEAAGMEDRRGQRLGLLAGVWADGYVRVIDVEAPRGEDSLETIFIHVEKAFFECRPPKTVCTSVAWLSSSHVAAGCANGHVAIWNLSACLSSHADEPVVPSLYQSFHHTYILNISSAYPSRPHLLCTTSMDGYVRLTDLRAPATDTVLSSRARVGASTLAWLDAMQSFIVPDEAPTIRAHPIRRFISSFMIARPGASALALAASLLHPYILISSANGIISVVNPTARIFEPKGRLLQQIWFAHDWRPGSTSQSEAGEGNDLIVGQAPSVTTSPRVPSSHVHHPLSRITEGYKPTESKSHINDREDKTTVVPMTIYEKETAATAVCWNPNPSYSGWAAAGLGCGLLRVQDLAV